jgi:RND family efflux transporter MFP subunit
MRFRLLFLLVRWMVALAFLVGVVALVYALHEIVYERRGTGAAGERAQETKRTENNVVKLGAELAGSLGLKVEATKEVEWHQGFSVYGRVVSNPRAIVEVRAPFAGTLRVAPHGSWPALGSRVEAGDVLGWLDIRVGPQERLDLEMKLREARAKLQGAEEVFKIQQERVARFQTLEGPGAVSRADLDPALVQRSEARTQLATAKASAQQWEDALAEISHQGGDRKGSLWSQPLKAPAAGEITDLAGRPGMALEAGGLVARVVDFRRALVRLDIPSLALGEGPPSAVELFTSAERPPAMEGATNRPQPGSSVQSVRAQLVGPAPQIEASSQFAGYWYEADTAPHGGLWRPGLFVKALLKLKEAKPQHAVAVPETALLYHQGRALVYVQITPGKFERREVQVLGREASCSVLASGVTPGEFIVSRRAQVLLSEEFRSAADND